MPSTIVPGIWIVNYLNNKQVKVCYSDVSSIQIFTVQDNVWLFQKINKLKRSEVLKVIEQDKKTDNDLVSQTTKSDHFNTWLDLYLSIKHVQLN